MGADSIVIKITPTSRLTDLSSRDVTIRFWSPSHETERRINQTRRFSFNSKKRSAARDTSPAPINPVLQARLEADVRLIPFSSLIFFLAAFLLSTTAVLFLALKPTSQVASKFSVSEVSQNNLPAQAAIIPIKMETKFLPVVTSAELPSVSDDSLAVPTKRPHAKKRSRSKYRDRLAMKLVAQDPTAPGPENGNGDMKLDDNPY